VVLTLPTHANKSKQFACHSPVATGLVAHPGHLEFGPETWTWPQSRETVHGHILEQRMHTTQPGRLLAGPMIDYVVPCCTASAGGGTLRNPGEVDTAAPRVFQGAPNTTARLLGGHAVDLL
jgi:hypothetical protein